MGFLVGLLQLLAGLVIGTVIVAGYLWLAPKLRLGASVDRARARFAMTRTAERVPWARVSGAVDPVLLLERRGYRGRAEVRGGRQPVSEVTFDIQGAMDGWLQVAPEGLARAVIKTFGVSDVVTGDDQFDDEHEISASSEAFARRVLDADTRSLLRPVGAYSSFVFRLTPHLLLLRVERILYDPGELETLLMTASNLLGSLGLPDANAVDVGEMREVLSRDAQCEVCGSKLSVGAVVRCRKCRTPHHRDCWEFNGVCSTFACGSRESE